MDDAHDGGAVSHIQHMGLKFENDDFISCRFSSSKNTKNPEISILETPRDSKSSVGLLTSEFSRIKAVMRWFCKM